MKAKHFAYQIIQKEYSTKPYQWRFNGGYFCYFIVNICSVTPVLKQTVDGYIATQDQKDH
jgi:hypothetical protein